MITTPKGQEPPVQRRTDFEKLLCEAISKHLRVRLRYKTDIAERTYDPYAVYFTSNHKVCVTGTQISNPAKPLDNGKPHILEVGHLRSLELTSVRFHVEVWYTGSSKKFAGGTICEV
jgi:hypothetical protein